ncbi:MAG TPA: hypothetical protein VIJ35_15005, partial [Bradyrhizobium sp.]
MRGEQIAWHNRTNAGRSAGVNQIAGAERDLPRQLRHHFGHAPDHLPDVAALMLYTVYQQGDGAALEMPGIARGRNIAAWRGRIETLADFPWQPEIAGVALAIAARQIDADGIPPDMIDRISNSNVAASAADRNDQLDLELEVGCEWRI